MLFFSLCSSFYCRCGLTSYKNGRKCVSVVNQNIVREDITEAAASNIVLCDSPVYRIYLRCRFFNMYADRLAEKCSYMTNGRTRVRLFSAIFHSSY